MPRRDLPESELELLVRWARVTLEPRRRDQVEAVVAELRALRERESNTRFLMEIEGEV